MSRHAYFFLGLLFIAHMIASEIENKMVLQSEQNLSIVTTVFTVQYSRYFTETLRNCEHCVFYNTCETALKWPKIQIRMASNNTDFTYDFEDPFVKQLTNLLSESSTKEIDEWIRTKQDEGLLPEDLNALWFTCDDIRNVTLVTVLCAPSVPLETFKHVLDVHCLDPFPLDSNCLTPFEDVCLTIKSGLPKETKELFQAKRRELLAKDKVLGYTILGYIAAKSKRPQ